MGPADEPVVASDTEEYISPAPRVSVQAFCETAETAAAVQAAAEDRRMVKAHVRVQMGGVAAAAEAYRSSPTPNVICLESEVRSEDILAGLDELAEVCDPGTRVVVIGRFNDIVLYRELLRRGVSDYMIAPVKPLDVVRSICNLFSAPDAKPVGRVVAVVGAKGGSAPRRSPTISLSRSPAISPSIPSSPISTSPSAPPGSTSTRTRRRASPTPCFRRTGSIPHSWTGCCRNAPSI